MNFQSHSHTEHQTVTDTKRFLLSVTLLQFGLYMIVGLSTMIIVPLVVSGDSTTQRQSVTTPQSTQQK